MSCDALWVLGRKKGEYCLRTRGNEKYGKTMLIPTLLIPLLIERT
jgi:hypothetical protein